MTVPLDETPPIITGPITTLPPAGPSEDCDLPRPVELLHVQLLHETPAITVLTLEDPTEFTVTTSRALTAYGVEKNWGGEHHPGRSHGRHLPHHACGGDGEWEHPPMSPPPPPPGGTNLVPYPALDLFPSLILYPDGSIAQPPPPPPLPYTIPYPALSLFPSVNLYPGDPGGTSTDNDFPGAGVYPSTGLYPDGFGPQRNASYPSSGEYPLAELYPSDIPGFAFPETGLYPEGGQFPSDPTVVPPPPVVVPLWLGDNVFPADDLWPGGTEGLP